MVGEITNVSLHHSELWREGHKNIVSQFAFIIGKAALDSPQGLDNRH